MQLRRLAASAFAALLGAALAPAAPAQAIIVPRPPDRVGPESPGALPLEVRSLAVETSIRGRVATTLVDQVFRNPAGATVEGTYLFPLPEGASVERFSMFVDGKEVRGELLDAGHARGIYESIVRRRRDPALLEFVGTRLFRASIFPIGPGEEKRVKLSYSEVLTGDAGTVGWRLPLANCRHLPRPIGRASLLVDVETRRPLASVYSPTHAVDVSRRDPRRVRVSWEAADVAPDQDLVLILQEPAGELGFSFAASRPAGEEGTFLLLLAPAVRADARPLPRDVVLCMDTSGSMAGEKIEQAKGALRYAVRTLGPEDRFALVTFSTEPRRFREALVRAGEEEKAAALEFVDAIRAVGGTCIDDALRTSLAYLGKGDRVRPALVIFVTDGLPTIGERDPKRILENARGGAGERVRLFSFGVGYDVNAVLLDSLADALRGARDYVAPKEDIERKVSSLVAKTSHPVMTDVTISVEGIEVRDLHPRRLPDLFLGSELAILGRYVGAGAAVVRVEGRVLGETREFVNEVSFPRREDGAGFLPRLWAARRIGHLLDEIRLRGQTPELREEVVRLAKRHGILTPYTSYLVLESEEMLRRLGRGDGGAVGTPLADAGGEMRERLRRLAEEGGLAPAEPADPGGSGSGGAGGGGSGGPAPARAPAGGKPAVDASNEAKKLQEAESLEAGRDGRAGSGLDGLVRRIDGKTFYLKDGVWVDSEAPEDAPRVRIAAFSDDYLALAAKDRTLARAFSLGRVVVKSGDAVYEVVDG